MVAAALRVDNAIGLLSPEEGGWRAQVLYARGAMNGSAPLPEEAGNRNVHMALSLGLGYTRLYDHVSGVGNGDASQLSIQYKYYLSKRTTVYLGHARLSQRDLRGNLVLQGAAVVQPAARIASVPGGAIRGLQLGIAHTF